MLIKKTADLLVNPRPKEHTKINCNRILWILLTTVIPSCLFEV
jgi:hypothetical protein